MARLRERSSVPRDVETPRNEVSVPKANPAVGNSHPVTGLEDLYLPLVFSKGRFLFDVFSF